MSGWVVEGACLGQVAFLGADVVQGNFIEGVAIGSGTWRAPGVLVGRAAQALAEWRGPGRSPLACCSKRTCCMMLLHLCLLWTSLWQTAGGAIERVLSQPAGLMSMVEVLSVAPRALHSVCCQSRGDLGLHFATDVPGPSMQNSTCNAQVS